MLGSAIKLEAAKLKYEVIAPSHKDCSIIDGAELLSHFSVVDAVINAAGTIKSSSNDYETNALGPLRIAKLAKMYSSRLVHVSTDCVFSGKFGPWNTVLDTPDPIDLYGVSKRYGEIAVQQEYPEAVVLRTSFIGLEHGLTAWFRSQPENAIVKGYGQVFWSGSTAIEVASRILKDVIPRSHSGIQHLAIEQPMSKYEVLLELQKHFRPDIKIVRVSEPLIQRALKPTIVMNDIRSSIGELAKRVK